MTSEGGLAPSWTSSCGGRAEQRMAAKQARRVLLMDRPRNRRVEEPGIDSSEAAHTYQTAADTEHFSVSEAALRCTSPSVGASAPGSLSAGVLATAAKAFSMHLTFDRLYSAKPADTAHPITWYLQSPSWLSGVPSGSAVAECHTRREIVAATSITRNRCSWTDASG
eukprot:CAMPEP_0175285568 /NCGR_PEP_ID=MMETSP0093-20121207/53305_1 /TAXON_ID=311494 /ORGANISM="Alexandrium monilatum, Strain CCMP3105" /LENGTH=166 /DNA_ID=CAMNT_0016580987 /DNA_START=122 /DNA_END=618 /DNA_ORIENTATION=-